MYQVLPDAKRSPVWHAPSLLEARQAGVKGKFVLGIDGQAALDVERALYGGVCLAAGYSGHRLNHDKEAGYTGPQELPRSDRSVGTFLGT